jgi:hypothetical protein
LIATIYVAISVPYFASFPGQTCCYRNTTYLPHIDVSTYSSSEGISDNFNDLSAKMSGSNTSHHDLESKSRIHTRSVAEYNISMRKQNQINEALQSSTNSTNDQTNVPKKLFKQRTNLKSNSSSITNRITVGLFFYVL